MAAKMSVVYNGRFRHAQSILGDLRYGKDDFNSFADAVEKYFPVEHTRFFGDATLPEGLMREQNLGRYDRRMHVWTPSNVPAGDVKVFLHRPKRSQDDRNDFHTCSTFRSIAKEVVEYTGTADLRISPDFYEKKYGRFSKLRKEGFSLTFPEQEAEFRVSPAFDLMYLEISKKGDVSDRDYPKVRYEIQRGGHDAFVVNITVSDEGRETEGYAFAQKIAELLPSASTRFYDASTQNWEHIRDGYDLRTVNPIVPLIQKRSEEAAVPPKIKVHTSVPLW